MLKKIANSFSSSNRKPRKCHGAIAAAIVEVLEARRLLSTVTVNGDPMGISTFDTITVSLTSGGTVITQNVDGNISTTPKSSVTGIVINGFDFSDTITVDSNVDLPVTINGGDGDDTITGGGANDSLVGGAGNDTYKFSGSNNLGSDVINEAANTDIDAIDFTGFSQSAALNLGSTGSQTVHSGILSLTLSSATGIEIVTGSNLADSLTGNSRDNTIMGEGGNDTLNGSGGSDSITGDDGADLIYGDSSASTGDGTGAADTITGGSNDDTIYGE